MPPNKELLEIYSAASNLGRRMDAGPLARPAGLTPPPRGEASPHSSDQARPGFVLTSAWPGKPRGRGCALAQPSTDSAIQCSSYSADLLAWYGWSEV